MKTIDEIEENSIEFVRWARTKFAEEHGYDPVRMAAAWRAGEAELRAKGYKFADFSQPRTSYQQTADQHQPSIACEDPPAHP